MISVQATACTENQGFPYPQQWGLEWTPECRLHGPPLESVHISLGNRTGPPVPVRSDICLLWQASRPPHRSKFVRQQGGGGESEDCAYIGYSFVGKR